MSSSNSPRIRRVSSGLQATFYGHPDFGSVKPARPVRVVVLTSVRDVGACDLNGSHLGWLDGQYMTGAVQAMVVASRFGALRDLIEVVGVITDDHPTDDLGGYSVLPQPNERWLHSYDLRMSNGQRLVEATTNIPSSFRKLPRNNREGRRQAKLQFERDILAFMTRVNADVLLSDHYMARLEHVMCSETGLGMGRVLNIHPAITREGHRYCLRGKTPTQDAIDLARSRRQPVFTGATLHFVNSVIDDGPLLTLVEGTPVNATDRAQELRLRNYGMAKLPGLIAGLQHYAQCIWPHLPENAPSPDRVLDLNGLVPV